MDAPCNTLVMLDFYEAGTVSRARQQPNSLNGMQEKLEKRENRIIENTLSPKSSYCWWELSP